MASTEKPVKKKKEKTGKKKLDISALAVIDNIVFSKNEKWAYYRLSNSVYDFLSVDGKVSIAAQLVNALANLMSDRQEPLDCHLIVASTPVDVDAWEEQVTTVSEDWDRAPGFDRYVQDQLNYLRREEYLKKVTYLGINLGKRGALSLDATSFVESGLKGAWENIKDWTNTALQIPGEEISETEEKDTRRVEDEFYRTLSTGNMAADRVTAEEILLLIKRQFYPGMPAPYLDVDHENRIGPGDLDLELCSAVENKLRWLKFDQMYYEHELTGYRATLTISRLPKEVEMPYTMPFMYFMHKIGLPFNCYARFTLLPNNKMKKELEKKKKETADELTNLAEGGENADSMTGNAPADVVESIRDMQLLNQMLAEGKHPWVEGVYRVIVETRTEADLKKYCDTVRQKFVDIDVAVNWTAGDQAQLFLEQMPGDHLREKSHRHITDLVFLGTSGFNYSSDVGDLVSGSDAAEGAGL